MANKSQSLKPSDCVLAFGIPTCESEFWDAQNDSLGRDFLKNKIWEKYDFQFVKYLNKVEPRLVKLGLKIVHKLTLQDFGKLFRDSSNKVIILFSHWKDNTVEFFDGMATEDEIISVIPNDFDGIIDLCVCHPNNLPIRIRNHLPPTSLIRYTNVKNTPVIWLYFYWSVFTILGDSKDSDDDDSNTPYYEAYLKALEKSIKEFKETENIL